MRGGRVWRAFVLHKKVEGDNQRRRKTGKHRCSSKKVFGCTPTKTDAWLSGLSMAGGAVTMTHPVLTLAAVTLPHNVHVMWALNKALRHMDGLGWDCHDICHYYGGP